jgi:anti-sigma-K factor RskA
MNERASDHDRLLELLADQTLFGLSPAEQTELEQLSAQFPEVELDSMEQLAAMVEMSHLPAAAELLPDDLQAKIKAGIQEFAVPEAAPAAKKVLRPVNNDGGWPHVPSWVGWATAAALLVALVFSQQPKTPAVPSPENIAAAARQALMDEATDLVRIEWTATGDEAAPTGTGDVVWSNTAQQGYMRFAGLAANDPTQQQYQLWIFDAEQDEKYPIDGGVFDIPAGASEFIIPIDPKLNVAKPTMFAITVEKPGGVVVSSRERIPLLAKLGG